MLCSSTELTSYFHMLSNSSVLMAFFCALSAPMCSWLSGLFKVPKQSAITSLGVLSSFLVQSRCNQVSSTLSGSIKLNQCFIHHLQRTLMCTFAGRIHERCGRREEGGGGSGQDRLRGAAGGDRAGRWELVIAQLQIPTGHACAAQGMED
eukprot:scaffold280634_cov18-Tisochrysis_lutea.AAC.1